MAWRAVVSGRHVDDPDELPEGTVLPGNYIIKRRIGRGGMGTVYEAVQTGLNRRVAVKVLKPMLARDEGHLERFRREATSSAMLEHPNIVQVTDLQRSGDLAFFVMEYLEGNPLSRIIRREGQMGLARSARIMSQVCSALQVAHDAGVVHRDLKPPNVFVTPLAGGVEVAKLLDFGIQKLREGDGYARLTRTGAVVGTPQYLSPEQARGETVDPRTDVFAAGVLLYVMVTGQLPFYESDLTEMMKRIMSGPPHPLETFRGDIPANFARLILTAIEKNPEDRWQSAKEMGEQLNLVLNSLPSQDSVRPTGPSVHPDAKAESATPSERPSGRVSSRHSSPTDSAIQLPESRKNRWLLYVMGGAAVVLLGTATLVIAAAFMGNDGAPSAGDVASSASELNWSVPNFDLATIESPKPSPDGRGLMTPQAIGVFPCDEYARATCECNLLEPCRLSHARIEYLRQNPAPTGALQSVLTQCRAWLSSVPPACAR